MLTDNQYHDLAQKGKNNDRVISRLELENRTLKEQNQQLFQDNESLHGDAQTGRGIRDLKENHPELYNQADALIQNGLKQPNQPTTTELEADIQNLRNTFKTDPKLAEVDTQILENVLDIVARGIQAPQAALQTLRDEVAQNNTKVQKHEQQMLSQQQVNQQREGQELQNRLKVEAKKHDITLDYSDPKMEAIYTYMGKLEYSVEKAFRLAYNLPDEPVSNGNQPEIQTTQTEQIPMAMQPRANGTNNANGNFSRTAKVGITKEQQKVSQWMYGNRMMPRR